VIDGARIRGMHVIAMLHTTPCWASTAPEALKQGCRGAWWDRGVTAYPPANPESYGIAAGWVARRWGDRLAAIEVWNEPNYELFLNSPEPARDYGALLRSAYAHVKEERPKLAVLGGSIALADGAFLEQLYDQGGIAGHYDGIAWHPYTETYPPTGRAPKTPVEYSFRDGAALLRRIMRRHGDRRGELWATEAGASTCALGSHPRCVSPATQADWIEDYVALAREMPFLRALIVYNLRDKGTDRGDIEQGFGLVERDYTPKPSFEAFRRAVGGR
jgi:polysaccharide biosynthesis protein PslG